MSSEEAQAEGVDVVTARDDHTDINFLHKQVWTTKWFCICIYICLYHNICYVLRMNQDLARALIPYHTIPYHTTTTTIPYYTTILYHNTTTIIIIIWPNLHPVRLWCVFLTIFQTIFDNPLDCQKLIELGLDPDEECSGGENGDGANYIVLCYTMYIVLTAVLSSHIATISNDCTFIIIHWCTYTYAYTYIYDHAGWCACCVARLGRTGAFFLYSSEFRSM